MLKEKKLRETIDSHVKCSNDLLSWLKNIEKEKAIAFKIEKVSCCKEEKER